MTLPLFVNRAVLLLTIFQFVCADEVVTSSYSGRKVPLDEVKRHVPSYIRDNPERHLYELDEAAKVIVGNDGVTISIDDLGERHFISSDRRSIVMKNGLQIDSSQLKSVVYTRSNANYIATYIDDQIISVDGPSVLLRPIDAVSNYGLFVNVYSAKARTSEKSTDDIRYTSHIVLRNIARSRNQSTHIKLNAPNLEPSMKGKSESLSTISTRQLCSEGVKHWVELAVAFDSTLCSDYGSFENTEAAIRAMVNEANERYTNNTCVEIYLGYIEGFCDPQVDPYGFKKSSAGDTLDAFGLYWQENRKFVRRDTAHLITGYGDDTTTLGVAFVEAMCGNAAFGYTEGVDSQVFTHELGHNLGCTHADSGLMTAFIDRLQFYFSDESIRQIQEYLEFNFESSCVSSTSEAACDSTCPVKCEGSECLRPSTAEAGLVGCSKVQDDHYCGTVLPKFFGQNVYINSTCDERYPYMLREYDENDPTVTCCRDFGTEFVRDFVGPKDLTFLSTFSGFQNTILPADNMIEIARFDAEEVPSCSLSSITVSPTAPSVPSSVEPTHSPTSEPFISFSLTPSPSLIPSESLSQSPTESLSATPTNSITLTSSISATPSTPSISFTSSTLPTPSSTFSIEATITAPILASISASFSSLLSMSVSPSESTSFSPTILNSPPISPTSSASKSASPSISFETVVTNPQTMSPSSTLSTSPSNSKLTQTPYPSVSMTASALQTQSTSPSVTGFTSPFPSESQSASFSPPSSISMSVSPSTSSSSSTTASPTMVLFNSPSASEQTSNSPIMSESSSPSSSSTNPSNGPSMTSSQLLPFVPSRSGIPTPIPSDSRTPSPSSLPILSSSPSPTPTNTGTEATQKLNAPFMSSNQTVLPSDIASLTPTPEQIQSQITNATQGAIESSSSTALATPADEARTSSTASPTLSTLFIPSPSISMKQTTIPSVLQSPSLSISISPIPSQSVKQPNDISISPFSSVSRSPSISATPSLLPAVVNSCKEFFSWGRGFKCSRTIKKVQVGTLGIVKVKVYIRSNQIDFIVKGMKKKIIRSCSYDFTTPGMPRKYRNFSSRRSKRTMKIRTKMTISDMGTTVRCCGHGAITGHFKVVLCDTSGQNCGQSEFTLPLKTRCGRLCRKNNSAFYGEAMSEGRLCPRCVRRS